MAYPSQLLSSVNRYNSFAWASVQTDVDLARNTKANVLIVGTKGVGDLLGFVAPDFKSVVTVLSQNGRLLFPPGSAQLRTAIIRDVDTLTCEEQRRVLEWLLNAAPNRIQVVSTASKPLLPLVETGAFNEALYYRLNTLYIDLSE